MRVHSSLQKYENEDTVMCINCFSTLNGYFLSFHTYV